MDKKYRVCLIFFILCIFSISVYADIGNYEELQNPLIVVGKTAMADDVIGGSGIAASQAAIQAMETVQIKLPKNFKIPDGIDRTVLVLGDAVEIGREGDILEFAETLGNVREVVTENDVEGLQGGTIITDEGATDYTQYIRFENSTNTNNSIDSGVVTFDMNDDDELKYFLRFLEDDVMFQYELDFEEGLKSGIECASGRACNGSNIRVLNDLEDEEINILGDVFSIIRAQVLTDNDFIKLDLLGGGVLDTLEEGEAKTYTIKGKEYDVSLPIVSDSKESDEGVAKFVVNGETTKDMKDGEITVLKDKTVIGIREILPNEAEEAGGDLVEFYIGATKIEFTDSNYSDDVFEQTVKVNHEDIEDGSVSISASSLDNETFRIEKIRYSLKAESNKGGDVFIPVYDGLRNHLKEPEGMLSENWDITFKGFTFDPLWYSSIVQLIPKADEAYDLYFTNIEGLSFVIPFVDNSNDEGNGFKYGDEDNELVFIECANSSDFCINKSDLFILTDNGGASFPAGDEKSTTYILSYDDIDTSDKEITFKVWAQELEGSTKAVSYSGTEGDNAKGELIVGGNTFTVFVGNATGNPIAFDLNNDGDVGGDEVNIVINGGGIIDIGPNQSIDNASRLDSIAVTFTTLASEFDEDGLLNFGIPEVATLNVSEESDNKVDVEFVPVATGFIVSSFDDIDAQAAVTAYGTLAVKSDEKEEDADKLTLAYPAYRAGTHVFIEFGETKLVPLSVMPILGGYDVKALLDFDPVGFKQFIASVDLSRLGEGLVPSTKQVSSKLDTEVSLEEKQNNDIILFGGPCINKLAEELAEKGKTMTCEEWREHQNEGLIQEVKDAFANGQNAIIVAGYSNIDTKKAAYVLSNYQKFENKLKKEKKVIITGNFLDPEIK